MMNTGDIVMKVDDNRHLYLVIHPTFGINPPVRYLVENVYGDRFSMPPDSLLLANERGAEWEARRIVKSVLE